ncbi:MAG: alpha-amylase, partial [Anaerolineales bacterium]|nr:alpha-amylase [Anaerolineales bacterium]
MNLPLTFEFHISKTARERYQFDDTLFGLSGNVVFANFHAARLFAQKMNAQRDLVRFPERAVKAGQITAMGLIDEILHYLARQYRQQVNPQALDKALTWLADKLGQAELDATLARFVQDFPPRPVQHGEQTVAEYLEGESEGLSHRTISLEELLMLWLANNNPAFSLYRELFDDQELADDTAYFQVTQELETFFDTQPTFGPDKLTLVKLLRAPALASPHDLMGQLEFLRERFGLLLGSFLMRLLSSIDLIKEEQKPVFFGPGPVEVPEFAGLEGLPEEERFSPDSDWMPRTVLLAKNSYVWLDQLSQQYHRPIRRLDQIPDEELDHLARWGITGLWLIGLWERSPASQRIKQLCGNPEAVPSAYSLYDYVVANDLGGDDAYNNL